MDRDEGVLPAIAGLIQRCSPVDSHSSIISDADHPGGNPVRRNTPKVGGSVDEPVRHSDEAAISREEYIAASAGLVQRGEAADIREVPLSNPPGGDPGPVDDEHNQSNSAVSGRVGSGSEAADGCTKHISASADAG